MSSRTIFPLIRSITSRTSCRSRSCVSSSLFSERRPTHSVCTILLPSVGYSDFASSVRRSHSDDPDRDAHGRWPNEVRGEDGDVSRMQDGAQVKQQCQGYEEALNLWDHRSLTEVQVARCATTVVLGWASCTRSRSTLYLRCKSASQGCGLSVSAARDRCIRFVPFSGGAKH